jgi:hypothetical protein
MDMLGLGTSWASYLLWPWPVARGTETLCVKPTRITRQGTISKPGLGIWDIYFVSSLPANACKFQLRSWKAGKTRLLLLNGRAAETQTHT